LDRDHLLLEYIQCLFVQQKQQVLFYIVRVHQLLNVFDHEVLLMVKQLKLSVLFQLYHHLNFLMIVGYNLIQPNPEKKFNKYFLHDKLSIQGLQ
jgi:hypothetical protein